MINIPALRKVSNSDERSLDDSGLGDLRGLPPLLVGIGIVEKVVECGKLSDLSKLVKCGAEIIREQFSGQDVPRVADFAIGAGLVAGATTCLRTLIEAHIRAPLPELPAKLRASLAEIKSPGELVQIIGDAAEHIASARSIAEITACIDPASAGEIAKLAKAVQVAHRAGGRLLDVMAPLVQQRDGETLQ